MADSKTKQITDGIVAALDAIDKPAGVTVNKSRRTPASVSQLPMYSVYRVHREIAEVGGDPRKPARLRRTMTVEIKVRVPGDDDALDVHEQYVIAKMNGTNLGGAATNVSEKTADYQGEESTDSEIAVAILQYEVEYITPGASL
jgi:hypothetical protein